MRCPMFTCILLSILILACSSTKKQWEFAKQENTKDSYQKFLRQNSKIAKDRNNFYAISAKTAIDSIDWETAKSINTIESYERYVKEHRTTWWDPKVGTYWGRFNDEAKLTADKLAWEQALQSNTIESIQAYLEEYRDSNHRAAANQILDELQWKKALKMHNIKSFENYLKKSEEGKYKNTALAIVDSLRWEKAKKDNNVTSHERYLDWLFEESALKYKEEALLYLSQNKSIADFPKYSINGFKYIQSPIDSILMTGYSIKINGDEYRVFKDTKFFVFLDNLLDNLNVKLPVYRENFVSSVKKGDQISMTILDINGETDVVVEIAIISTKVILDQINEIK